MEVKLLSSKSPTSVAITTSKRSHHKVLAFGDSLTYGWYANGYKIHPFSLRLEERLNSGDIDISSSSSSDAADKSIVVPFGYPGATAAEILAKMQKYVAKGIVRDIDIKEFDTVIVLGGTNDLGDGTKAKDIIKALETMYKLVLNDLKMRLVAISIPDSQYVISTLKFDDTHKIVNEWIKTFCASRDNCFFIDLYHLIPFKSEGEGSELWDDSLHFSPKGYDKIGEALFEKVTW